MKKAGRMTVLFCCLVASPLLWAQERKNTAASISSAEQAENIDVSKADESDTATKALRFTASHEASLGGAARGIVNNRSWFRVEYSKFFLDSFFVQVDSKLNAYWAKDHRALAKDKRVLAETNTPEAFLQYSAAGGRTSVKAGVQRLIWGESEAGAITDEVSPRNLSELFFVPLEESRIGQFMVNLDHFSKLGDWSFFFVPRPKFNKYPKVGTAYHIDPFNGLADLHDDPASKKHGEYGMRWKRTFGQSDVSLMAASLIDNDYVLRADAVSATGRQSISRLKKRFTLTGATFNHAAGKFLFKGEIGLKSPKWFNDSALQIVSKDVIDSSLGVTYSLGQSNTLGVELVNSHVRKWGEHIASIQKNTRSLVLNTNFFFLNDTLSVNWLTLYSQPFSAYQSSIRASYKWRDDTTFSVDAHLLDVPDRRSPLHGYRDRDQIVFRLQHQF